MIRIRPATGFCGCFSLTLGVLWVGFTVLFKAFMCLGVVSSKEPLHIGGVKIGPTFQMIQCAVSILGVPVAILAGIGALYRIERHVTLLFYYMVVAFSLDSYWWLRFMTQGSVCDAMVPPHVKIMGSTFICSVVNIIAFFWTTVVLIYTLYTIFVVWSMSEVLYKSDHPDIWEPPPPFATRPSGKDVPIGPPMFAYGTQWGDDPEWLGAKGLGAGRSYPQAPTAGYIVDWQPIAGYVGDPSRQRPGHGNPDRQSRDRRGYGDTESLNQAGYGGPNRFSGYGGPVGYAGQDYGGPAIG